MKFKHSYVWVMKIFNPVVEWNEILSIYNRGYEMKFLLKRLGNNINLNNECVTQN